MKEPLITCTGFIEAFFATENVFNTVYSGLISSKSTSSEGRASRAAASKQHSVMFGALDIKIERELLKVGFSMPTENIFTTSPLIRELKSMKECLDAGKYDKIAAEDLVSGEFRKHVATRFSSAKKRVDDFVAWIRRFGTDDVGRRLQVLPLIDRLELLTLPDYIKAMVIGAVFEEIIPQKLSRPYNEDLKRKGIEKTFKAKLEELQPPVHVDKLKHKIENAVRLNNLRALDPSYRKKN